MSIAAHHTKEQLAKYNRTYYEKNREKRLADSREHYLKNKEKRSVQSKARIFKEKYDLTLEELDLLILQQNNKCAICDCEFEARRHTHVDHCHKTGKVRKVLCRHCNIGLGHFRDNPDYLQKAIEYLKQYEEDN